MAKKRAAAVLAVILLAVLFKQLGKSEIFTVTTDVTRATASYSQAIFPTEKTTEYVQETEDADETAAPLSMQNKRREGYYYNHLSTVEKKAYNNVIAKIYSMPSEVRVPKLSQEELNNFYQAMIYDNPDLFFVSTKCSVSSIGSLAFCNLSYRMTEGEYKKALKQVESERDKILSSLTDPDDEWQTELEIHDALTEKLDYKYSTEENWYSTIYGALVNGTASCEGYSKAAKYLFDKVGIESYVVGGYGTDYDNITEPHMWNIVRINDYYCQLDITWDDPVNSTHSSHIYFNITDKDINVDHSKWHFDYDCTSTSQSYSRVKGFYFTSFGKGNYDSLARAIAKELDSGADVIELKFSDSTAFSAGYNSLIKYEGIYKVLIKASLYSKVKFSTTSLSFSQNEKSNTMIIVPNFK